MGDEIALTPPMGWNSWNCWARDVTQEQILSSARAMVEKGLADHVGYLKQVDYGDMQEDNMTNDSIDICGTAEVIAESGTTVRMRSRPLKNAPIVANVKVGTLVNLLETTSDWCQIEANGKVGYMMSKFLNKLDSVQESEPDLSDSIDIRALVNRVAKLEARVTVLEGGVG